MKAGTAAALIANCERKAVADRVPYLQVFHGTDDAAELHDAPHISPHSVGIGQRFAESENAAGLTYTGFFPRRRRTRGSRNRGPPFTLAGCRIRPTEASSHGSPALRSLLDRRCHVFPLLSV